MAQITEQHQVLHTIETIETPINEMGSLEGPHAILRPCATPITRGLTQIALTKVIKRNLKPLLHPILMDLLLRLHLAPRTVQDAVSLPQCWHTTLPVKRVRRSRSVDASLT